MKAITFIMNCYITEIFTKTMHHKVAKITGGYERIYELDTKKEWKEHIAITSELFLLFHHIVVLVILPTENQALLCLPF